MISGEIGVIRLNHMGVAVPSIDKAVPFYEQLFGYKVVSGPFHDPIQKVSVSFLGLHEHGDITLELVEPEGDQSPVSKILSKDIGAYHLCLEVQDMDHALSQAKLYRCVIVSEPVPAVAFNGRLIAWFYTPTRQLVEILAQ